MTYDRYGGLAMPSLTPAVKALLIVNGGVFLLNALLQGAVSDWIGLSWSGLGDGYGLGIVRLVTYQFAHSFEDPFHLIYNMLVLYFFGTFVEGEVGRQRLLWLYVLSGIAGGLLHMLISSAGVVGASGACYGIMVYAAFLAPRMRVIFLIFPIEMRWLVGILVAVGAYQLFVELSRNFSGGTAHGAHLGGALWGYVAFRMARAGVGLDFGITDKIRRLRAGRARRVDQDRQAVLDRLLDKVHREGISSLTAAERRFLDKTSQEMRRK